MLKRTSLFSSHQALGARLVEFGGWEMPVQYTGIIDEHLAVRTAAGLFDISHMGEVLLSGQAAADFLNRSLTNDIRKLAPGQGQYTLLCNERGGVIDDLYAYRIGDADFLLIINASRIDEDMQWLRSRHAVFPENGTVRLEDASGAFGAVAVQGPRVAEFIDACFPQASLRPVPGRAASSLKKNEIARFALASTEVWLGRTGYTGEDGFEIIGAAEQMPALWDRILALGKPCGLKPCGLGARDTLRTEMGFPLYGHELDEQITPLEAGLGFFVALDKGEFIGRPVLAEQKANGVVRRCIAFKMVDHSAPPRPHYPIWSSGPEPQAVGRVVSGTRSPSLNVGIGMGYVPTALSKPGTPIEIEIRGRRFRAEVVSKPIYKKPI